MSLSREAIGEAALELVQQGGLSSLSMRGVATALGVQPGALYWHVESKQELLALLAGRILAEEPFADGADTGANDGSDPRPGAAAAGRQPADLASDLRASLLAVRDGAEIVSFARALHPDQPLPVEPVRLALERARGVDERTVTERQSSETRWAAGALVHFVLGYVAEEQNRAELARAGVAHTEAADDEGPSAASPSADDNATAHENPTADTDRDEPPAFTYGVQAILRGARSLSDR